MNRNPSTTSTTRVGIFSAIFTATFYTATLSIAAFVVVLPEMASAAPKHSKHRGASSTAQPDAESEVEGDVEGKARSGPRECQAATLVDAASGDTLFELNAHQPLPPASMVKLMSSYVILKKVKDGAAKLTDTIETSALASKIGGSQVYLKEHEQFPLGTLLEAVLIQSANDAVTAIAEYLGGSPSGFVDMMNSEAKELGMTEAEFHSPHGLPPGQGQKPDLVSAHDFALLARRLISDFPDVLQTTGKISSDFRDGKFVMTNHNHLLRSYPGCDGLKTGFYNEAGFCITATAKRNDMRMIAVVMGCGDRKKRDSEASRLLSLGFAQFRSVKLIEKGTPIAIEVPVTDGTKLSVVPVAANDLLATIRPEDKPKITQQNLTCKVLTAPVAPNTPCGTVTYSLGDRALGSVDLVVPEEIPALGISGKVKRYIGM